MQQWKKENPLCLSDRNRKNPGRIENGVLLQEALLGLLIMSLAVSLFVCVCTVLKKTGGSIEKEIKTEWVSSD